MTGVDQLPQIFIGSQQRAVVHDVFADAAAQRPGLMFVGTGVTRIGKRNQAGRFVVQGYGKVFRADKLFDDGVDVHEKGLLVQRGSGQLGNVEKRRLQPLGALALADLLLEHAIGLGQLLRTTCHALFQLVLALATLQRGEHMAGDKGQHVAILLRVADPFQIALHHQRAVADAIALHRHAQPVAAVRPHRPHAIANLADQLLRPAHQRLAGRQHVPGQRAMPVIGGHLHARRRAVVSTRSA